MINFKNVKLYEEYTLQDLIKQVIDNTQSNRQQLLQAIQEIATKVETPTDLQIISPQIANYMNIIVKNDQLLLKLTNAIAKIITTNDNSDNSDDVDWEQLRSLIKETEKLHQDIKQQQEQ